MNRFNALGVALTIVVAIISSHPSTASASFTLNQTRLIYTLNSTLPQLKITNTSQNIKKYTVRTESWKQGPNKNSPLIVSPNTFSLAPNEVQTLAFYLVGQPVAPQYHRIYLKESGAVKGDIDTTFVIPFYTAEADDSPKLSVNQYGSQVSITNMGTHPFFLERVLYGSDLVKRQITIFPGQTKAFEGPGTPEALLDHRGQAFTLQ